MVTKAELRQSLGPACRRERGGHPGDRSNQGGPRRRGGPVGAVGLHGQGAGHAAAGGPLRQGGGGGLLNHVAGA